MTLPDASTGEYERGSAGAGRPVTRAAAGPARRPALSQAAAFWLATLLVFGPVSDYLGAGG